ncbi:MAG: hypothetical protein ACKPKO_61185, partial [Candidatus Fonsibacter sp.]
MQVISPDQIMFSGRLPDHLLHAGTVLDEAVVLARLHTDKLGLTSALNTSATGVWERSARQSPSDSLIQFGDILKGRTAIAMNPRWDACLA